jgi:hypothetical protein
LPDGNDWLAPEGTARWWLRENPFEYKKTGQPFRITQSQLRDVLKHIGLLAPEIKPCFNVF